MSSDTRRAELADLIDAVLPQTQCRRCGYDDCRAYAEAVALDGVAINRCPPGGAEGIARLAAVTGRPALPLDPATGSEGPLALARIDEAWCIGCTLCIAACPVDCIVGAPKRMHVVVAAQCTGCGLCVPACPVDCIALAAVPGADPAATGWAAWSGARAAAARERHDVRRLRLAAGGLAAAASRDAADDGPVAGAIDVAARPRGDATREAADEARAAAVAGTAPAPGAGIPASVACPPSAAAVPPASAAASPETSRPCAGARPPHGAAPLRQEAAPATSPGASAVDAQPARDAATAGPDVAARLRAQVAAAVERARRARGA